MDINKLYGEAQLALASYSDFSSGYSNDKVFNSLVSGDSPPDFTATSAQSFVDKFSVISQYTDPNGSGFSATVFQNKQTQQIYFVPRGTEGFSDIGDINADAMLAAGTLPADQIVEMVNYFLRLQAGPGGMAQQLIYTPPVDPITPGGVITLSTELVPGIGAPDGSVIDVSNVCVAGHSLGGYLGMALAPIFGGNIQSINTYNAPGFYGDYSTFDTIVSLLGTSLQPFASGRTTNITGIGLDIIPAVGVTPGNDLNVFLESNAHSQKDLVDSLAVYDLLARVDDTLTVDDITGILSASSNIAGSSLESAVTALGELLHVSNTTFTGSEFDSNRDLLYTVYRDINLAIDAAYGANASAGLTIESFATTATDGTVTAKSATEIASLAQGDVAYRYALVNGNSFAVIGADYTAFNQNGGLDIYDPNTGQGQLSTNYLDDRADYLSTLLTYNINEYINSLNNTRYIDATSGNLYTESGTPDEVIIFGNDNSGNGVSELNGTVYNDHIYGMGGDDILDGKEGADYLEGGLGYDTYQAGDGDTLLDCDGIGRVMFGDKLLIGGHLQADGSYLSNDGLFNYRLDNTVLTVTGPDGVLTINDFSDGELGISLGAAEATPGDPNNTITGDLTPIEFPLTGGGTNWHYDSYGNVITTGTAMLNRDDMLFDSAGNDAILAGGGDDTISAWRGGDDTIQAGDGQDNVYAGEGNDLVEGGAETDILSGGAGDDRLYADSEVDIATFIANGNGAAGVTRDWLSGGAGNDLLVGSSGSDGLVGGGGSDIIAGGAGDDNILGDATYVVHSADWTYVDINGQRIFSPMSGIRSPADGAADVIYAGGGNDFVWGGLGEDYVLGEEGDDYLVGEEGSDLLLGGSGADIVFGDGSYIDGAQHGNDYLYGGADNDQLVGGGANDTLIGGTGDDQLWGDGDGDAQYDGRDTLSGGEGNDQLIGGGNDDVLYGGDGADRMHGDDNSLDAQYHGNDILFGGAGDDQILGGGGDDILDGGDDSDTLWGDDPDIAGADHGDDTLSGGAGNDTLMGNGGNDTLVGGEGDDQLEGDGIDLAAADHGNDVIDGGAGNDRIYGDGGNDSLSGGTGDDYIEGDSIDISELEHGSDMLNGGAGNDTLLGLGGHDSLFGGSGNDTLNGGSGYNYLNGGEGDDTYRITDSGGIDYIQAGAGMDNVVFENVSSANAQIYRVNDDLHISGGGSQVVLINWYASGSGNVSQVTFSNGVSLSSTKLTMLGLQQQGDNGSNTMTGFDDAPNDLSGGAGNDTLLGGSMNDLLAGGEGNDTLWGKAGSDSLNGGLGADTYIIGDAGSSDRLVDNAADGAVNTVRFIAGISEADATAVLSGDDLLLSFANGSSATLVGYNTSPETWKFQTASGKAFTVDALFADNQSHDDASVIAAEKERFLEAHYAALQGGEIAPLHGDIRITPLSTTTDDASRALLEELLQTNPEAAIQLFTTMGVNGYHFQLDSDMFNRWDDAAEVISVEGSEGYDNIIPSAPSSSDSYNLPAYIRMSSFSIDENGDYVTSIAGCSYSRPGDIPANELQSDGDMYKGYLRATVSVNRTTHSIQSISAGGGGDVVGQFDMSGVGHNYGPLVVDGGAGYDTLFGGSSDDFLAGGDNDDFLHGYAGDDVLAGGNGSDWLSGGDGNDTYLAGFDGTGTDTIGDDGSAFGGDVHGYLMEMSGLSNAAIDNYLVNMDDAEAAQLIQESNGSLSLEEDRLKLNATSDEVRFSWVAPDANGRVGIAVNSLTNPDASVVMRLRGDGDAVGYGVEHVVFSDGSSMSRAEIEASLPPIPTQFPVEGTFGNDSLDGSDSNDILVGKAGDDDIYGGDGDDVYLYNAGDGYDYIYDYSYDTENSGTDTLSFGASINPADVKASLLFDDMGAEQYSVLTLQIGDTSDLIEIEWLWKYDNGQIVELEDSRIEYLQFVAADGTQVFDLAGIINARRDELAAAYDQQVMLPLFTADVLANFDVTADVAPAGGESAYNYALTGDMYTPPTEPTVNEIVGTALADTLTGSDMADVITAGAGNDTINGGAGVDTYVYNLGDGIDFITDSGSNTLQFGDGITPSDISLSIGSLQINVGTDGQVHLENFDPNNPYDNVTIDRFEFADGTVLSYAQLLELGFDLSGTTGNDTISGTAVQDRINGFAGDDTITAGAGDDVIDGGEGADYLAGGAGNDTYLFRPGDGNDVIEDGQGADTLYVGNGLIATDLEGERVGNDAVIKLVGSGDSITLRNWYLNNEGVKQIVFSDGSSLDQSGIEGLFNQPPIANPDSLTAFEDGGIVITPTSSLLANDTDPNPTDILTVESIGASAIGATVSLINGEVHYDIGNRFQELKAGAVVYDSFDYTINDGNGTTATSTVTVTIVGTNDGPVAEVDVGAATEDGPTVTLTAADLMANDHDIDQGDSMSIASVSAQSAAGAMVSMVNGDVQYAMGSLFQELAEGETTTDTFEYTIVDSAGATSTTTVTMTITGTNDAPIVTADTAAVHEDVTLTATGNVLINDSDIDQGDILSVANAGTYVGQYGTLTLNTDGSYSYALDNSSMTVQSLAEGQLASESFDYIATDGMAETASTLTISITGTNDAPIVTADTAAVEEDVTLTTTGNVLTNDSDIDQGDILSVANAGTYVGQYGTLTLNTDGSYSYALDNSSMTVQSLAEGQLASESFDYIATDGMAETASTLTINITGSNDAPIVTADTAAVTEDVTLTATGNVLTNDSDIDQGDVLSVSNAGTYVGQYGTLTLNTDGSYSYALDNTAQSVQSLAEGQVVTESFAYTATDGMAETASTLTISITGTNDAPIVTADTAAVHEDVTLTATGNVLINDSDIDQGDILSVANAGTYVGQYGTLTLNTDGSYSYALDNSSMTVQSLAEGQVVTESFAYTATDGMAETASTLTISITGTNDAPIVVADTAAVEEDVTLTATGNVLTNDSDIDQGDILSVANAGTYVGQYGTLTLNTDGSYSYALDNTAQSVQSLAEGQVVTESFAYTATDGMAETASTLTISITGTNDAPVVNVPLSDQEAYEEVPFSYQIPSDTFTDIDQGDTLSYSATLANGDPLPEWLSFDPATQTLSSSLPDGEAAGIWSIRVTATDPHGASAYSDFKLDVADLIQGTCEEDTLIGSGLRDVIVGFGDDDVLLGNGANDVLVGGTGQDILQGGEGDDILIAETPADAAQLEGAPLLAEPDCCDDDDDHHDDDDEHHHGHHKEEHCERKHIASNLLDGGAGNDKLYGGAGNDILIGGAGNDTIDTGAGHNLIAFNLGDGNDTVLANAEAENTLSLGGGIDLSDLSFSKSGNDLVLEMRGSDNITLSDWYSSEENHNIVTLQIISEATDECDLHQKRRHDDKHDRHHEQEDQLNVTNLDFSALVACFEQSGVTDHWSLTEAKLKHHLEHHNSEDDIVGGDLAGQYALHGSFDGMSYDAMQDALKEVNMGDRRRTAGCR